MSSVRQCYVDLFGNEYGVTGVCCNIICFPILCPLETCEFVIKSACVCALSAIVCPYSFCKLCCEGPKSEAIGTEEKYKSSPHLNPKEDGIIVA